ncbi:hypothetical protein NNJEOMEG_04032 [Fundidesulfovibrio magnetotacticus]|uniref:Uncharacterized protein n=1 Tax=Fundidesulfovibrio magnetotacticus TaxID=2730080 RepID=A0A6V8LUL1_9BACT|nr:hypothetical protein NNJEOMEG_04032 [Fundidesulfovibrio magnetotacticus]
MYGAEKKPDGSPRLYSLSPHEDEDMYAIAKKPGRSEGTAEQPMIDPIFVASSGLTGGAKAFVQTEGPTLYKLGSGLLGGAMGSGRSVGFQVLGSKLP